jgi:chlorobactene glucosyltransferase
MSDKTQARVSVIIPARNEEANIARAVLSVVFQQGIREILVVDDQSEDRTGEILEELKSKVPLLRTLRVEALPEGWLGKTHALAMAARQATGNWLLFTDADAEHLPGSLSTLLELAERERVDLLSVSPGQRTLTWWEKSVIPLVYAHLARLYRFDEVSDPKSPVAAANGQYMLIRRAAFERAGGHEAVRSEILEDVALARRIKVTGGKLLFLPGAAWVQTRMYRNFTDMWRGWSKNLYLLYGRKLNRMFESLVLLWLLDLIPAVGLIASCLWLVLERGRTVTVLIAVACFMVALVRQWSYSRELNRLGFDPSLGAYQVPGALLFGLLLVNSAIAHRLTRRVEWKGRTYSTKAAE